MINTFFLDVHTYLCHRKALLFKKCTQPVSEIIAFLTTRVDTILSASTWVPTLDR